MKAKCRIVKSGSHRPFGSHSIFPSMSLQRLSFSPSTLIKYIDTVCNFGKLRTFITSHTKPSEALQVLQGGYVDVYNQPFICSSSFTLFFKNVLFHFTAHFSDSLDGLYY